MEIGITQDGVYTLKDFIVNNEFIFERDEDQYILLTYVNSSKDLPYHAPEILKRRFKGGTDELVKILISENIIKQM